MTHSCCPAVAELQVFLPAFDAMLARQPSRSKERKARSQGQKPRKAAKKLAME